MLLTNVRGKMDKASYLKILQIKHNELDRRISQQQRVVYLDNLNIMPLKKEKLRLKEAIKKYRDTQDDYVSRPSRAHRE